MPDYTFTSIYLIRDDLNNDILYVGHTTQTIGDRWLAHRSCANNESRMQLIHEFMAYHGCRQFSIEVIEPYPCSNLSEALQREQVWIDELHPLFNCHRASNTLDNDTDTEQDDEIATKLPKRRRSANYRINLPRSTDNRGKREFLARFSEFL